jgi:excisionase family DNA binding protein
MSEQYISDNLLVTVPEAARRLAIAEGTLRNWLRAGLIPSIRVRAAVRVRVDVVEAIAREGLSRSAPSPRA